MKPTILTALLLSSAASVYAISGKEGDFEYAIDAPWRIEPRKPSICSTLQPCVPAYRIPIQISFHDLHLQLMDILPNRPNMSGMEQFESVTVEERRAGQPSQFTTYRLNDVHEVEYTGASWPWPVSAIPLSSVCRRWRGEDCTSFGRLATPSEWHATLFYTPKVQTGGETVKLSVSVRVKRAQSYPTTTISLTDELRVYLGAAPLPRFSSSWAYGDLHYHSQGTDNEGESAYSYRGVLQAVAAIGLDFVFATDHASNSEQIIDISGLVPQPLKKGLRDLSPERFAHNSGSLLNGAAGANSQVLSYPWDRFGMKRVPQIFLGSELDVTPETPKPRPGETKPFVINGTVSTITEQLLDYGNGLTYDLNRICVEKPWYTMFLFAGCITASGLLDPVPGETNRFMIRDLQGLAKTDSYSRQHLIHLPEYANRLDAFVPGNTAEFGGARKRLRDADREMNGKGVYFLAHPNSISEGRGAGRLGPDLMPYTDVQLRDAFASQSFLGLQFWNEDGRLTNESIVETENMAGFETGVFEFKPWNQTIGRWHRTESDHLYRSLHHGAFVWDKMLLWGLDPSRTSGLTWLPLGEPRRVFMAGGSDAHGDLNFRRQGYVMGTDSISDTAIGKPRNLVNLANDFSVYLPGPQPVQQNLVVQALKRGEFAVTDGPAVRIAIDSNGNNIIDTGDVMMGSVTELIPDNQTKVLVEWESTTEFGPVTRVELYVGVSADGTPKGAVYAPLYHAVRNPEDPGPELTAVSAGGRTFYQRHDGYWAKGGTVDLRCPPYLPEADVQSRRGERPVQDALRKCPSTSEAMKGTAEFTIRPSEFTVVQRDVFPFGAVQTKIAAPQRMYVRAFVSTSKSEPDQLQCDVAPSTCIPRFGYTNPIWARLRTPTTPPPVVR